MSGTQIFILGILIFLVMFSCIFFYQAWLLIAGRSQRALEIYKLDEKVLPPTLARHHGILLALLGARFLFVPVLAVAWQISLTGWVGLLSFGAIPFFLGKMVIEKVHGIPRS